MGKDLQMRKNKFPGTAGTIQRMSIINFTGMRPNWGCQSTSWELLKFINSVFPSGALPEVALIPLLPRCDADQHLEQTSLAEVHEAILATCAKTAGHSAALAFLERICMQRYGSYADQVKNSDLVIFQAEGTLAGTDIVRGARLLLLPVVAKHAWNKPVYALNQTIFLCNDEFTAVAAAAYNSFDLVAVRENISLDMARRAGINPVYLIPDMAFLTTPGPDARLPDLTGGRFFAVTGSAYFAPDIYQRIFQLAQKIKQDTGLKPLLAASGADNGLLDLARKSWAPSEYEVVPRDVSYASAAFAMKRCKFLIGGRYHMTIMAASVGVPSVQLYGNSYKNVGLSAMLDGLFPVRSPDDGQRVMQDVSMLLDRPAEQASALAHAMQAVHHSLDEARQWLARSLRGEETEIPNALLTPPGRHVDALAHLEPYRRATIAQAHAFAYPVSTSDAERLGPKPSAKNIFPVLRSAVAAGDTQAKDVVLQILKSYPALLSEADPVLRREMEALLSSPCSTPAQKPGNKQPEMTLIQYLLNASLSDLKARIVRGDVRVYSFFPKADIDEQAEMLRQEFIGRTELELYHAVLMALIRRGIDLTRNLERVHDLWSQETTFLCQNLDSRWLVSACDTIMDYSPKAHERALAAAASLFTNTLKLYETERYATGQSGTPIGYKAITERVPLHDGMCAFLIGRGDMIANLHRRVLAVCDADTPAAAILRELLHRASEHDTVYKRLKDVHKNKVTAWSRTKVKT
jgi:polysaccharide pyruvyl transferase WcaK-like protein